MLIIEANTWEEIETVTDKAETCIAPLGTRAWIGQNHDRAKETWEKHRGRVRYFLVGNNAYARIIRANQQEYQYPTWIVDYMKPTDYLLVAQIAQRIQGALLVKDFTATNQDITKGWQRLTTEFSSLKIFPYTAQSSDESTWLVVPGTQPYKPAGAAATQLDYLDS